MRIDVDMNDEGLRRLPDCLPQGADAEAVAEMVGKAGANEALLLATEQADVPSSLGDMRKLRVYCLIRAGLPMETLEPVVAATFKLTPRQARGLVDSTLARYSARLAGEVTAQIRNALDKATDGDHDDYFESDWPLFLLLHGRHPRAILMPFGNEGFGRPTTLSLARQHLFRSHFEFAEAVYCLNAWAHSYANSVICRRRRVDDHAIELDLDRVWRAVRIHAAFIKVTSVEHWILVHKDPLLAIAVVKDYLHSSWEGVVIDPLCCNA